MKYLLDTDWAIDHLNNIAKVTTRLEELAAEGVAISVISLAELSLLTNNRRHYEAIRGLKIL